MSVPIDTTIWSRAFRRRELAEDDVRLVDELGRLIDQDRATSIGMVRQEVRLHEPE